VVALGAALLVQNKFLRIYDPEFVLLDLDVDQFRLNLPLSQHKQGAMVQVLSPGCPCNGFSRDHIGLLTKKSQKYVDHFVWLVGAGEDSVRQRYAESLGIPIQNVQWRTQRELSWLPATPAALIVNRDQRLAYVGPFSDGVRCTSDNSFVDRVLGNVATGLTVFTQLNSQVHGCFCQL